MSEEEQNDILSGDDALIATADLLYQKMSADSRFEEAFQDLDLPTLADKLRRLLGKAFEGEDWPELRVDTGLIDGCFDDFGSALVEAMEQSESSLLTSLDKLQTDMGEDERMARFYEHIRNASTNLGAEEEEGEGEEGAGEEGEEGADHEDSQNKAEEDAALSKATAGSEINVNSFDDLILEQGTVQAANDAWRLFISTAESREAAGEAIYAALFEGAPSLQSLFVTPRAVQAMRFMNGLASFVLALNDPPKLKILVETLGFGHLHLDVTVPRVIIFRDAIIDLFTLELAEKFNAAARDGWKRLLNYVGGAIIFVKAHYAERIHTLLRSWRQANHGDSDKDAHALNDSSGAAAEEEQKKKQAEQASKNQKKSSLGKFFGSKNNNNTGQETGGAEAHMKEVKAGNDNSTGISAQNVPTTYPEMFLFNAAVMGFGTSSWMSEVLACFDNIVTNVSNSARLQEECDVLGLRIARVTKGVVNFGEYKSCMLASLRSLLPKDWDSAHEVAWTWLWENVERLLRKVEGNPPVWEKALGKILASLDEEVKFELRKDIYSRFFTLAPSGQDFFKQSNTYLHFIADKILDMTLQLYQNPVKMVDDVSALGLRHVGYAIPTELFGPFVTACVEVLMTRTSDETTVEAFRWSLGLVSKMLVRTITEGSTIVMKAINTNSQKLLKKAISCAPRGERARWMLLVQVGTQSISPLAWSIESGNFEAAVAMIRDLLTFRADRDRYYYGVDDLFKRHPDLIKMLCDMAPDIIPKLLNGLVWRSRTTDNGLRRVNYYVKHLLIDEEGNFAKTLQWITATKDPKLVCHPVIVLVSDIVWSRVAYRSFLYGKSWLLFTLLLFITSQSILEHLNQNKGDVERGLIFGCRCFIYLLSMTRLLYSHVREFYLAFKNKTTMKALGCIPIPRYLKQWQDMASFCLTISLIVMLSLEPILWCASHQDGKLFNEDCPEKDHLRMPYSIFVMFTMFLYFSLLIDLTVVSTRISAFNLVCLRMLPEVALFIGALAVCILTFSSAISVLKHDSDEFAGIHKGAYALLRMSLGVYSTSKYASFRDEATALAVIFVFCITIVSLLNMLIAQLSCAYSSVYEDMVGYARLQRATIIVEIMPSIPRKQWLRFVEYLQLNKKIEFNAGDVGISGGLASKEPANMNPTTQDMIRRFGGSTSVEIQWPEDDQDGDDGDDRFDRMEKLIQKTLQRVTKSGGSRGKGGAGGSSSQNTGGSADNKASGSGESGGSVVEDDL
jgi:hypothetical protein